MFTFQFLNDIIYSYIKKAIWHLAIRQNWCYGQFWKQNTISNFSCRFLNPNFFFQLICEISKNNLKSIRFQKLVWLFTVAMNCSSDLKQFEKFFSINRTKFFSEQFWKKNLLFLCSWNFSFILMHFLTIVAQRCVLMPTAYCFANEFLNPDT